MTWYWIATVYCVVMWLVIMLKGVKDLDKDLDKDRG